MIDAVTPDVATAIATYPCERRKARSTRYKKVLPVPPGLSIKKLDLLSWILNPESNQMHAFIQHSIFEEEADLLDQSVSQFHFEFFYSGAHHNRM